MILVLTVFLCLNNAAPSEWFRNSAAKLQHADTMQESKTTKASPHRQIKLSEQDIQRFWSKVKSESESNGCLLWQGGFFSSGYALFSIKGEPFRASRVAYTIYHGGIPDGLIVLHGCDDPRCVSKKCLHVGTNEDNTRECVERGRHKPWGGSTGKRRRGVWYPETVIRGDQHWTRVNPERLKRGSEHPNFGKIVGPSGSTHHFAKLDDDKVREIRSKYALGGVTQTSLAEEYNVKQTVISDVVRRKIWKHVT